MIETSNSQAGAQRTGERCEPGPGAENEWTQELHYERLMPISICRSEHRYQSSGYRLSDWAVPDRVLVIYL